MICVDPMVKYTSGGYPYGHSSWEACHLFADDDDMESLHHVARLLGLKRGWFQDGRYPPHYDLFGKGKREAALAHGAREVSRRHPVQLRRRKERW